MKVTFSKSEMYTLKGCYKNETLEACSFMRTDSDTVTLSQILDSEIPLKDKLWFCGEGTGLNSTESRRFVLLCAKAVLPIYENAHPDDNRVRACIEVTERYLNGTATREELSAACSAARASASAASSAYYAASSAYYVAAYSVPGAAYAYTYTHAYAHAAAACPADTSATLIQSVKEFFGLKGTRLCLIA